MSVATVETRRLFTAEEYLIRERAAEYKSEYWDGEIVAISGGSPRHSALIVNTTVAVGFRLKGSPCQAHSSDMKVRTSSRRLYAYPDLTVVCGKPRYDEPFGDVLLNPTVIFEALSPSTEAADRGRKFDRYKTIESLTDYVLIAQASPNIYHFTRQSDNQWMLTFVGGDDAILHIPAIGIEVPVSEIYDRVEFDPDPDLEADDSESEPPDV